MHKYSVNKNLFDTYTAIISALSLHSPRVVVASWGHIALPYLEV